MCFWPDFVETRKVRRSKAPIVCYSARFLHADGTMRSPYMGFKFGDGINIAEDATGNMLNTQIGFHLSLEKGSMMYFVRSKAQHIRDYHLDRQGKTHLVLCEYEIDPDDVVYVGQTDTGAYWLGKTILVRRLMGKGKIVLEVDLRTLKETA